MNEGAAVTALRPITILIPAKTLVIPTSIEGQRDVVIVDEGD